MIETLTEEILHKMSPQELTLLLYQRLLKSLEESIDAIRDKHFDRANHELQRCSDLLYRLGAGINYGAGIIADQLEALYQYLADRCIEANIRKDIGIISEMIKITSILAEAWEKAMKQSEQNSLTAMQGKAAIYEFYEEVNTLDIKE